MTMPAPRRGWKTLCFGSESPAGVNPDTVRRAAAAGYRPAATKADNCGMPARTLADWLEYIERQHPKSIAMGLERVREVAARMGLHYRPL